MSVLNPNGYLPTPYNASILIAIIHNHTLRTNNYFGSIFEPSRLTTYAWGLAIVPLILLAGWIAFAIATCLGHRCCCCVTKHLRSPLFRWIGLVSFIILIAASCVPWVFAILRINVNSAMLSPLVDSIFRIRDVFTGIVDSSNDVKDTALTLRSNLTNPGNCDLSGVRSLSALQEILQEVDNFEVSFGSIIGNLLNSTDTWMATIEDVSRNLDIISVAIAFFHAALIVISAVFLLFVIALFLEDRKQIVSVLISYNVCFVSFLLGSILTTVVFIISLVLFPIGAISSDFCAVSPNERFLDIILRDVANKPRNLCELLASGFIFPPGSISPGQANFARDWCFYTTCKNVTNEVESNAEMQINFNQSLAASIQDLLDNIDETTCDLIRRSANEVSVLSSQLSSNILTNLSCETVNAEYQLIVEDTACNYLVVQLVEAFAFYACGTTLLLLALEFYQAFSLDSVHSKSLAKKRSNRY